MSGNNGDIEKQLPLIIYRLDATAQVLEDIKIVLNIQTENLASLLVLQEKHNNLQNTVNLLRKEILDKIPEIDTHGEFISKFHGGLYVFIFLFTIIQGMVLYEYSEMTNRIKSLEDISSKNTSAIYILEQEKNYANQQRNNPTNQVPSRK